MKPYFSVENYEQDFPSVKDTLVRLLKKFWRFSLYYGEFVSQRPERRRGNLKGS
jgi:hypothetical protein